MKCKLLIPKVQFLISASFIISLESILHGLIFFFPHKLHQIRKNTMILITFDKHPEKIRQSGVIQQNN